ncbi:MAG: ABC transporter permease [Gemmatimonadota bacterium]
MRILIRRALEALVLTWLVVSITFVVARLAPGDPVELLIPASATPEDAQRLRVAFGLDQSIAVQYAKWLAGVLRGDLGLSFASGEPVGSVIARALPISIWLGATSLLVTFVAGTLIGFWQAARRSSWFDRIATVVTMTVFAAPAYWLSLVLVAVFTWGAARWGWPAALRLPAFGVEAPGSTATGAARILDIARHSVLPVSVLALIGAAGIARYARAAALDLMGSDFVRTARAKGLASRSVLLRHVGLNAVPQLIILLALSLPGVIAGSVFVETVFAWPGMGRAMLSAIAARDYPVIVAITIIYSLAVIAANALADVAIDRVDPRRRS